MARQMVDARRARAVAVDLLHQEPGRLRRAQPQRRLFLHGGRGVHDPRLRLAQRRCHPEAQTPATRDRGRGQALYRAHLRVQLPDHPRHGVFRARRDAARHPLHDGVRVDQPAFHRHHHLGALHEPGILPVLRDLRLLDPVPVHEAVLPADAGHLARHAGRVP